MSSNRACISRPSPSLLPALAIATARVKRNHRSRLWPQSAWHPGRACACGAEMAIQGLEATAARRVCSFLATGPILMRTVLSHQDNRCESSSGAALFGHALGRSWRRCSSRPGPLKEDELHLKLPQSGRASRSAQAPAGMGLHVIPEPPGSSCSDWLPALHAQTACRFE